MRVLYVFLDSTRSRGVISKVRSKIDSLNRLGVQTTGLFITPHISDFPTEASIVFVPFHPPSLPFFYNRRFIRNYKWYFLQRLQRRSLFETLEKNLSGRQFDLIILRYPLADKFFFSFMKKFGRKVVIENNTKEPEELLLKASSGQLANYIYRNELKYGPGSLGQSAGIIGVTNEIREYELKRS